MALDQNPCGWKDTVYCSLVESDPKIPWKAPQGPPSPTWRTTESLLLRGLKGGAKPPPTPEAAPSTRGDSLNSKWAPSSPHGLLGPNKQVLFLPHKAALGTHRQSASPSGLLGPDLFPGALPPRHHTLTPQGLPVLAVSTIPCQLPSSGCCLCGTQHRAMASGAGFAGQKMPV